MNRTAPVPRTVMKSYRGLIAMDKGVGYPPPPDTKTPLNMVCTYYLLKKTNKLLISCECKKYVFLCINMVNIYTHS